MMGEYPQEGGDMKHHNRYTRSAVPCAASVHPDRLPQVTRPHRFLAAAICTLLALTGCRRPLFPDVPDGYREFAYVSNGAANTVSVLDLVYLRQDRTLQVGLNPTGLAVNPVRNEVYVVNTGSPTGNGTVSIIETT